MAASDLQPLLRPRSIAVIGASSDFSKVNGRTLKYLLDKQYPGRIFPVNPKYERIGALRCYPSIDDIREPVDLAVIAVPGPMVADTVRGLGRCGVKAAVVFSSGFAETGPAGRALEEEVAAAARESGIRLCGPNCLGLVNAFDRVVATFGQFAEGEICAGPVGFVTQSGAFGTAIAALARRRGLGLGYFVNTGNEADVDFVSVMRALIEDPRIAVGAGYIEGLRNGRELVALADDALALGKPLVLTKVGRGRAGSRAAASHTGSLAGTDAVFDGVIHGCGIVRARNEEHMLDIVEAFVHCGLPGGRGLGIVTQSGGAGVLMADRAEELGLEVPVLADATQRALKAVIPGFGATGNPVDVTGQFIAEPDLLRAAVNVVLSDPQVHVGIVWLQLMDAHVDSLIRIFEEIRSEAAKPFLICWVAAPERALRLLHERGFAVLRGAEPAVDACAALVRYAEARRARLARSGWVSPGLPLLTMPESPGVVPTIAARALLEQCGISTVPSAFVRDPEEAASAARQLGFPVALKIESRDIPHKTEAGGVILDLADEAAVRLAFPALLENARRHQPRARIDGAVVQTMAQGWLELVVGLQNDPVFGMVVMVGLGGIHVEALKDVVFRAAPVTPDEAGRMLDALRARTLLDGARGRPPVDRDRLARLISAVSRLGVAAGDWLEELDLNPVLAGPNGAVAVDWLMISK